ncbi:hypothetical protein ACX1DX_00350 [Tessaracoccus sp. Y36]
MESTPRRGAGAAGPRRGIDGLPLLHAGGLRGRDSAWVSGTVRSDTNDAATNEALLEEVGRQIATVHRDNGARRSSIMVHVLSPNLTKYTFETMLDVDLATLDTLAAHYGIARR